MFSHLVKGSPFSILSPSPPCGGAVDFGAAAGRPRMECKNIGLIGKFLLGALNLLLSLRRRSLARSLDGRRNQEREAISNPLRWVLKGEGEHCARFVRAKAGGPGLVRSTHTHTHRPTKKLNCELGGFNDVVVDGGGGGSGGGLITAE